ncbi:MAG: BatD family protein [Candidatus Aminicenantes bacterium]|nr:BatD family protein [Candidatus Aminicenantes bacterium]
MFSKTLKILIVVMLTAAGGTVHLSSQDKISITASVDRSKITIGDLITYSVTITHAKNMEVELPSLGENLGQFEIRDYTQHKPYEKEGSIIEKVDYIISTFETGEFSIPSVSVKYRSSSEKDWKILETESLKIFVESLKPSQEGDIHPIKSPKEIPANRLRPIIFGALILLVLAAGAFLFFYIRRKRRKKPAGTRPQAPARPAHETALEGLRILSVSGLLESGRLKSFYVEISTIIRRYIEERYRVDALESTTQELLEKMAGLPLEKETIALLERFLNLCDLVKFAKFTPGNKENSRVMEWAVFFIERTKMGSFPGKEGTEPGEKPAAGGADEGKNETRLEKEG